MARLSEADYASRLGHGSHSSGTGMVWMLGEPNFEPFRDVCRTGVRVVTAVTRRQVPI
jgi:hypothetical protein